MKTFPVETTDYTTGSHRLTFKNNQTQGMEEQYVSRMFFQGEKEGMEEQYHGI